MSSDGSVMSSVSRIRQFGLYRSIDARTEEFLRASRKRQIRQGCACAAVSTAITVTVVVSVILVYEYSIYGESNNNRKFTIKPNWIGFMNESSDVTQTDAKFTKKINFDKTTMKLLPILIKALNTNRYLEKILEDYSSTNPPYDRQKDTTEFAFNTNVFDKKKWIKLPTSKLYTTDYKSSPSLLKMPTNNLDYFRRRRKMKDYKRMLNYFDKMVGDKVGPSQLVISNMFAYTESPPSKHHVTQPMKNFNYHTSKHKTTTIIVNKQVANNKENDEKEGLSCKCPSDLGHLLSKLISSLKNIIPNVVDSKVIPCEDKTYTKSTTSKTKSSQKGHTLRKSFNKITTEPIILKATELTTEENIYKSTGSSTFSSTDSNIVFHKIYFPQDKASPLTPNFKGDYNRYYSFYGNKMTTLPKNSDTSTAKFILKEKDKTLPTTTDYLLPKVKIASTSKINISSSKMKSTIKLPMPQDYDYDDYEFTAPSGNKSFRNTLHPDLDLVKPKSHSTTKENEPEFYLNSFRKLGSLSKYFDPSPTLRKTGENLTNTTESFNKKGKIKEVNLAPASKGNKLISLPKSKTDVMNSRFDPVTPYKVAVVTKKPKLFNIIRHNKTATENKITGMVKNVSKFRDGDPKTRSDPILSQELNLDSIITDADLDKNLPDDEFQEELSPKHIDNIIEIPFNYYNNSKFLDLWDMLKYDKRPVKSMLPPIRPVYLEVQRNSDWRHDDHHDYDSNYNNNAFDMPNI